MDSEKIHIIYILGGPGSGKGSICKTILSDPEFDGVVHVSIGDVLRREIEKKTEDGPIIEKTMKDGLLLPWSTIYKYLEKGIEEIVVETGKKCVLLDGFPRMVLQGTLFDALKKYQTHGAILLDCSHEEMLRRTSNRKDTLLRVDDNHATVLKRIEGYIKETLPVAEYYAEKGMLITVSSEGTVEQTYAELRPLLKDKLSLILTFQGQERS